MKFRLEKKKVVEKDSCETIYASYDSAKEWRMDPNGYFLIRINPETNKLEVGLCKKDNVIEIKVIGNNAEEICNTVLREGITLDASHVSYLGRELQKAEIACELGISYVQDDSLDVSEFKLGKKEEVREGNEDKKEKKEEDMEKL